MHSEGTFLKQNGKSIHEIKETLGQTDTRTTEIYLKNLGESAIDQMDEELFYPDKL